MPFAPNEFWHDSMPLLAMAIWLRNKSCWMFQTISPSIPRLLSWLFLISDYLLLVTFSFVVFSPCSLFFVLYYFCFITLFYSWCFIRNLGTKVLLFLHLYEPKYKRIDSAKNTKVNLWAVLYSTKVHFKERNINKNAPINVENSQKRRKLTRKIKIIA